MTRKNGGRWWSNSVGPVLDRPRTVGPVYWVLCFVLVAFGIVGAASIGAPFLLVGSLLVALSPFRYRLSVFWPTMLGVVTFVLLVAWVAPFGCESSDSAVSRFSGPAGSVHSSVDGQIGDRSNEHEDARQRGDVAVQQEITGRQDASDGEVHCRSLGGIEYVGRGDFSPPRWRIYLGALGAGLCVGFLLNRMLRRVQRRRPPRGPMSPHQLPKPIL